MTEEEKKAIEDIKYLIEDFKRHREKTLDKEFDDKQIDMFITILNLIEKQQKEIQNLKRDLKNVLNQTLGAFEHNWCIDWNFTEIREKYNIGSEDNE